MGCTLSYATPWSRGAIKHITAWLLRLRVVALQRLRHHVVVGTVADVAAAKHPPVGTARGALGAGGGEENAIQPSWEPCAQKKKRAAGKT